MNISRYDMAFRSRVNFNKSQERHVGSWQKINVKGKREPIFVKGVDNSP